MLDHLAMAAASTARSVAPTRESGCSREKFGTHVSAEACTNAVRNRRDAGRETLVIDTIGFEADSSGLGLNVPAGPRKHLVERLTLTEDRTRLRYEVTVEDPDFLTGPATFTQQWDQRPDLEFAQNTGACDPEVARRYKEHVPAE